MASTPTKSSPLTCMYGTLDTLTVTSSVLADVGAWDCKFIKTKNFYITAVSTQNCSIKILGSYDGGSNYSLVALSTFSMNNNSTDKQISAFFTNIKVQATVDSTVPGTTTVTVKYAGNNIY